jgi:hypothetical protein
LYTNRGYYSPPSFIQVVEANKKEVDEVLASEQDIRRQAGAAASGGSTAGMPGVAAGGGGGGTSTLVNAVDALPALMERKALGDAHLNILQVRLTTRLAMYTTRLAMYTTRLAMYKMHIRCTV